MANALLFLLDAVLGFLTLSLLLRFYMQAFRVSFNNQIGAFVVQLTNWAVKPLRKVIPSALGLDLSSLLPAFLMQAALVGAGLALHGAFELYALDQLLLGILWQALLGVLRVSLHLLVGALLLLFILSWVNPHSPIAYPVRQLTDPFLNPVRRLLPPIAGIDLSPMVLLLLVQFLLMLL